MWVMRFISLLLFAIMIAALLALMFRVMRMRQHAAKRKNHFMPSDDGLRALIAAGQMDEAVDLYSRFTGSDTESARTAVRDIIEETEITTFTYLSEPGETPRHISEGKQEK
jgi:hypothetical protein